MVSFINEILNNKSLNDAEKFVKLVDIFFKENLKIDGFLNYLITNKNSSENLINIFNYFFNNFQSKKNNKIYIKDFLGKNIERNKCYKIVGSITLTNDFNNLIYQIINKNNLSKEICDIFKRVVSYEGYLNLLLYQQKKSSICFIFEDFVYAKDIDDAIFLRDKKFELLNKEYYYFLSFSDLNLSSSLHPVFQFDTNEKNLFEFDFNNERTIEAWGVDLREAINNYEIGNWVSYFNTFESFSSNDGGESNFKIKIKNK